MRNILILCLVSSFVSIFIIVSASAGTVNSLHEWYNQTFKHEMGSVKNQAENDFYLDMVAYKSQMNDDIDDYQASLLKHHTKQIKEYKRNYVRELQATKDELLNTNFDNYKQNKEKELTDDIEDQVTTFLEETLSD